MKRDEYNLLRGIDQEMHYKRKGHILRKWVRRGWWHRNALTLEGQRIRGLIENKKKTLYPCDGRVVLATFIQDEWNIDETVGILEDHGDNGWHLFTTKTAVNDTSYFLDYAFDSIAYIDLHPHPEKIWSRLNGIYWRKRGVADRFHQKITTMSRGTVCDYSQASEGIFQYSHPLGKLGDCFPQCQCRHLPSNQ